MNTRESSTSTGHRICRTAVFLFSAMLLYISGMANAAEVTWTGSVNSSWSNPGNWDGGIPGLDDVARIPNISPNPQIDSVVALCSGIIIESGASLKLLEGVAGLYVIGDGDLDGDGISDRFEIEFGDPMIGDPGHIFDAQNYDADNDGIPNFAETDSDDDGVPDACEFEYYPELHPYESEGIDADADMDGFTNAEECAAGSDPTDPDDQPTPMPVTSLVGLIALCLFLVAVAILIIRRAGPRTRQVFLLLLAATLLPLGLYMGVRSVMAATLSVDFALGQTIEQAAATATSGDTLEINGASVRPWNGQSTYVNKPVTLEAVGGPVFLGGMHATIEAGILGQGSLDIESAYTGNDHSLQVSDTILAGSRVSVVFLGERLVFTLEAAPEWGFHEWRDDASGSDDPLNFQVLSDGSRVTALFGPPGPDLAASMNTGPPEDAQAGDTFNVVISIENIGQEDTTQAPWNDRLYLSRDSLLDDRDLELATVQQRSSELSAGTSYTASFSVTMSDVAPGQYYVLGVADKDVDVDLDIYRENNVTAAGMTVFDANLAQ